MKRIKFIVMRFLEEPLWFKILICTTLLISIVFSSSLFSSNAYYQGLSKLAAAIFFCAYGIKLRKSFLNTTIFFTATIICIYLFWHNISNV